MNFSVNEISPKYPGLSSFSNFSRAVKSVNDNTQNALPRTSLQTAGPAASSKTPNLFTWENAALAGGVALAAGAVLLKRRWGLPALPAGRSILQTIKSGYAGLKSALQNLGARHVLGDAVEVGGASLKTWGNPAKTANVLMMQSRHLDEAQKVTQLEQLREGGYKQAWEELDKLRSRLGAVSPHTFNEMETLRYDDLAYIQQHIRSTTGLRTPVQILDDAVAFRKTSQNYSLKELDKSRDGYSSFLSSNGGEALGKRVKFETDKISYSALADWKDVEKWINQIRATRIAGSKSLYKNSMVQRIHGLWSADLQHHMQQTASASPIRRLGGVDGVKALETYRDSLFSRGPTSTAFSSVEKFSYDDLFYLKTAENSFKKSVGVEKTDAIQNFMFKSETIGKLRHDGFEGIIEYPLENFRRSLLQQTFQHRGPLNADKYSKESLKALHARSIASKPIDITKIDDVANQYKIDEKDYFRFFADGKPNSAEWDKIISGLSETDSKTMADLTKKISSSKSNIDNATAMPVSDDVLAPHRNALRDFAGKLFDVECTQKVKPFFKKLFEDVDLDGSSTPELLAAKLKQNPDWLADAMEGIIKSQESKIGALPKSVADDYGNALVHAWTVKNRLHWDDGTINAQTELTALKAFQRLKWLRARLNGESTIF